MCLCVHCFVCWLLVFFIFSFFFAPIEGRLQLLLLLLMSLFYVVIVLMKMMLLLLWVFFIVLCSPLNSNGFLHLDKWNLSFPSMAHALTLIVPVFMFNSKPFFILYVFHCIVARCVAVAHTERMDQKEWTLLTGIGRVDNDNLMPVHLIFSSISGWKWRKINGCIIPTHRPAQPKLI